MVNKVRRTFIDECECYSIGNRELCFIVGRFLYFGNHLNPTCSTPDEFPSIVDARRAAVHFSNACATYDRITENIWL